MEPPSLVLPVEPVDPKRAPVPFVAALVPVIGGVVLWIVSGSAYALCFAALGPVMVFASLIDGARSRRRSRRAAAQASDAAWSTVEEELLRRQEHERAAQWRRHPDAAAALLDPPLRSAEPLGSQTPLVVGRGRVPSGIRISGGDGDRARSFRERCALLDDAPVTVPLGDGLCVRGPSPVVAAVARALAVQLCLRFGAGQMTLVGEELGDLGLSGFPHARASRRGAFRIGIAACGGRRPDAEAIIWLGPVNAETPDGIPAVLDVVEPVHAELRTRDAVVAVEAEALSRAQAIAVGAARPEEADDVDPLPRAVSLADLSQPRDIGRGLPAAIGRGEHGDVVVDIVEDGPHALVTGMTGTGKSELLVSWVTAITAAYGPSDVVFVLADFKGGTAFEPLRALPQVAAVMTDLDDSGARRGVSSLTAELRRREAALADAGVRDVRDTDLPRLVIVVDEFAALVQEHPDLAAVFTDVAARGRALGMHLILGTQRGTGVIRDGLAANCPLRLSLRVGDAADSRWIIGTDAAAEIPGGPASRGQALVRRPQDGAPLMLRVAMTSPADLSSAAARWAGEAAPASPWLPVLPACVPLSDLVPRRPRESAVLGIADVPERQAQPLELLRAGAERGLAVIGAPGSGRSAVLRGLAAQVDDHVWVPHDLEEAWDTVHALAAAETRLPSLVVCDDVDALIAELPADHAQAFLQRWEHLLRVARATTFVLTAARASGPVGRLLDTLPRRALLRLPSRVEHVAAGGDAGGFDRDRPPGRARVGSHEVQFAWVDDLTGVSSKGPVGAAAEDWQPTAAVTALVTTGPHGVARRLAETRGDCDVVLAPSDRVDAPRATDARRPLLLVGEAETWQRNWALWQRVRSDGEVLIRAESPAELRHLTGVREVPPFARPHAGRVWSIRGGGRPRRLVVPELVRS